MKNNNKLSKGLKIALIIYFSFWIIAMISYITVPRGDELAVNVLFTAFVLPLVTLITSVFIGRENCSKLKWFMIIFFAIMYIIPLLTWSSFSNLLTEIVDLYPFVVVGALISTVGMTIGTIMKKLSNKAFKISIIIGLIILILVPILFLRISAIDPDELANQPVVEDQDGIK